ncbi:MAG: sigma-54 interaction domain-containing protein, partial [Methylocystaceae bacterium]
EALLAMQVIEEIPRDYDYIVGETPGIYQVLDLVEKIKDIDFTVLVTGESGTGKELIARAIHERGKRAAQPFEILNCAALPAQLLESELFGYEKGAFTGATASYPGKFLMANQGSLFLDEIGELDLSVQAKLLRVLQDKVVTPLGSTSSKKVDVRIITATNRNLKQDVAVGRFRSDLYYRLNVIEIKMPPLRQRKEDIPMLISFFMRDIARHLKQPVKHLSPAATMVLEHYSYPGNVRELKNILERAAVVSPTQVIELADLPPYLFELDTENQMVNDERFINISYGEPLDAVERKVILMNLSRLQRPRREIAQVLGISERTLRNKLREYSLQEPDE